MSYLSMHLLFRPSATAIEDRRGLIFADELSPALVEEFLAYSRRAFRTNMAMLKGDGEPSYRLHDRVMAREQGLVHRVILTLAESLDEKATQTYVGQRVCELAQRIQGGDPVLYRIIQENPFLDAEVTGFQDRLGSFVV
jgi:prephenate dehydrogenase